jgi:hypothetical protein
VLVLVSLSISVFLLVGEQKGIVTIVYHKQGRIVQDQEISREVNYLQMDRDDAKGEGCKYYSCVGNDGVVRLSLWRVYR